MKYLAMIESYQPFNEQEAVDKKAIIQFIKQTDNHLDRTNLVAHLTSSAIVLNETYDKVLFAYHNIYDSWSWLGGHQDGNKDFLAVAIQETKEETGVKNVKPILEEIFMIDVIHVNNHIKHNLYVGDHLHLNVTFLLVASEKEKLIINKDENQGVKWFGLKDALNHVSEARMIPIYEKAIQKIKKLKLKRNERAEVNKNGKNRLL